MLLISGKTRQVPPRRVAVEECEDRKGLFSLSLTLVFSISQSPRSPPAAIFLEPPPPSPPSGDSTTLIPDSGFTCGNPQLRLSSFSLFPLLPHVSRARYPSYGGVVRNYLATPLPSSFRESGGRCFFLHVSVEISIIDTNSKIRKIRFKNTLMIFILSFSG